MKALKFSKNTIFVYFFENHKLFQLINKSSEMSMHDGFKFK